jgi:4-hydroxybenzoate polyprenyltransferase
MKKLFYILILLVTFKNTQCFVITKGLNFKNNSNLQKHYVINNYICNKKTNLVKKINSYNKLLRTSSVVPTFLLNVLGGWFVIPSYKLFLNKYFWLFSIITQLTMMNSMVINDLFDLKIDLINNNNRPLVTKEISIKEAQYLYLTLNIITNLLSIVFFNKNNLNIYIHGINLLLFLYTPFLKKIILLKNITCASVVSSTLLLTCKGVTNHSNSIINYNNNLNLIHITSKFLFLSSLYIELLLDSKDIHGDKENNIITIPNYFGIKKTFQCLTIIFISNLIYYSNFLYNSKNYILLFGFIVTNTNFIKNLLFLQKKIHLNKINKINEINETILNAVKETTSSLFFFILFLIISL